MGRVKGSKNKEASTDKSLLILTAEQRVRILASLIIEAVLPDDNKDKPSVELEAQ